MVDNISDRVIETPVWLLATVEDFEKVDVNSPVLESNSGSLRELGSLYKNQAELSEKAGNQSEHKVYSMISAVCSFYFKPSEINEPFGPMWQSQEGRSAKPSDFEGSPSDALISIIEGIENPALCARVSDTVWLLDRSRSIASILACKKYIELLQKIKNEELKPAYEEATIFSPHILDNLKRAVQISKAIGWNKEHTVAVKSFINSLRGEACAEVEVSGFQYLATLDLDYGITNPEIIAWEIETLLDEVERKDKRESLYQLAARAYHQSKNESEKSKCLMAAAECLVPDTSNSSGMAMMQVHQLEQAINVLNRVSTSEAKERKRELKHILIDVQSRVSDEFGTFSHPLDISEIVKEATEAVRGTTLWEGLKIFAQIASSPNPQGLREQAQELINEHPLHSLFAATIVDHEGKPVHRYPGGDLNVAEDDPVIQQQIVQNEKIRRNLVVSGELEPIRMIILTEHYFSEDFIRLICRESPCIPVDHEEIFIRGFMNYFHGNMIEALHILVPQLENSIRYILKQHGHDVIKVNSDMTQESVTLTYILGNLRAELNQILGEGTVTDIDNVFHYRGGPNLRNTLSHGQLLQWESYGNDAIYACWLIFRISCIPLFSNWDELGNKLNESG